MSKDNYKKIENQYLMGERSLFNEAHLQVDNTIFGNGESPLKEANDIQISNSNFQWKYPLWYGNDITASNCTWSEMARAGVWYTNNLTVKDTLIEAPKNFRRCNALTLENVFLPNAQETLWSCQNVVMKNVSAKGETEWAVSPM